MTREELEEIKRKLTHRNMVEWYTPMMELIIALEEAWAEIEEKKKAITAYKMALLEKDSNL